jgi:hypothetical protein
MTTLARPLGPADDALHVDAVVSVTLPYRIVIER